MRRRIRRPTGLIEIAGFWAMIIVISAVLAVLGFLAGKYWVGGLMARSKSAQTGPQVVLKPTEPGSEDSSGDGAPPRVEPPSRAVVKLQQRAPTDAERNEIEQMYPQDAADLHEKGGAEKGDDSTGSDTKPLGADGAGDGQRYAVVTGSYRQLANARREVERLADQGFEATIEKTTREGETYHRVVAGVYRDRVEAEATREQLAAAGHEASLSTR